MADLGKRKSSSRLQRRAPASIQINPVTEWNVAIPLLSPLIQSPTESDLTAAINSCCAKSSNNGKQSMVENPVVVVVMKKWQHPAAPFCYDPTPFLPFVCTGSFDR